MRYLRICDICAYVRNPYFLSSRVLNPVRLWSALISSGSQAWNALILRNFFYLVRAAASKAHNAFRGVCSASGAVAIIRWASS